MIDHIGDEKIPRQDRTAVRNFGQCPNGWTGDLEEWCPLFLIRKMNKMKDGQFIEKSNKVLYAYWWWQYVDIVLTNYVPAVAAIRMRLVLFILNRFKGYSDGRISLMKGTIFLEFYVRRSYSRVERWNSLIPRGLVKAKAIFYVKTDVEGRRLRAQKGLDTQVVLAVNDECHRLECSGL